MKPEILMNRILDGIDNINKDIKDIGERIVRVEDTVKRHDETTFPEMKAELKEQSNSLLRMESKQNEDMAKFIMEKEAMIARIKPLEQDYQERLTKKKDTEQKVVGFAWKATEKVLFAIIGAILISWQTILNNLKNFL